MAEIAYQPFCLAWCPAEAYPAIRIQKVFYFTKAIPGICLDVFTIDCRRFPRVRDVFIFVNRRGGEDMRLYTHKFEAHKRIND